MAIMDIATIKNAIDKIEIVESELQLIQDKFEQSIEGAKNDYIQDLSVVNKQIQQMIVNSKSDIQNEIFQLRTDCVNAIIASEASMLDTLNSTETSFNIKIDTIFHNLVQIIEQNIQKEITKQLSWKNIWKCLLQSFGENVKACGIKIRKKIKF